MHKHERDKGHQPGEILNIYKKGTILNEDGGVRCQIDGLFRRADGTWVLCEAKQTLTPETFGQATATVLCFKKYLTDILKSTTPVFLPKKYKNQLNEFKNLLLKNKNIAVVTYLGFDLCDPLFDTQTAKDCGFILVKPTQNGYEVESGPLEHSSI